jgi:tetratricopeptide (TPR) repeat protein
MLLATGLWVSSQAGAFAFTPQVPISKVDTVSHRVKDSEYLPLSRASAALEKGQNALALNDLRATVEQNPVNVLGLFHLGNAYLELAKQSTEPAQQARLTELALESFERVLDLNDDLTLVYFKLGKIALMKNEPLSAKRYYEQGLRTDPHNAALIFNLARVFDQLGDKAQAMKYYEKTISEDPNFTFAYNNLALLYEDGKDFANAEKAYKRALKKDPSYNLARLNLGNMYSAMGNYTAAQATLQAAQAQEPRNEWTYYYLGNMYLRMNDYASAVSAYNKVVVINPRHVTTYYLMAVAYSRLNKMDDALQASLHYLQLAPDGDYAREMQSLILAAKLSHSNGLYFTPQLP